MVVIFDAEALYVAMDARRRARNIEWRQVARESGMSPSTFTRIGHGHQPSANGIVRALRWLGTTDLAPFTKEAQR